MTDRCERLIETLSASLPPVRRMITPWRQAGLFLAVCGALMLLILLLVGPGLLLHKFREGREEVVAFLAAIATAGLAGLAAFTVAIPGRPWRWAWLPVPALLVWVMASGWGCWRAETVGYDSATLHPPMSCFRFIVLASLPLSLLLFVMLRRSYSLRPGLTALLGGLAAAAAAAALLDLVHPFEVTLPDLGAHAAAVLVVIGVNRWLSARGLGATR